MKNNKYRQRLRYLAFISLASVMAMILTGCGGDDDDGKEKPGGGGTEKTPYENADGINGGRLYSKFWATETGFTLTSSKLSSQDELDTIEDHADFFRCKQCHGWDRLGSNGGYSNRAPTTSRPRVVGLDLVNASEVSTPEELFNAIKTGGNRRGLDADLSAYDPDTNPGDGNRMPDYSAILTDAQIWDLVKFMKEEALDTADLYTLMLGDGVYPDRSRTFDDIGGNGLADNGHQIYAQRCASCHGSDGTAFKVDGGEYTVGAHLRAKPYEDQHKVKFGHLGSTMGAVMAESDVSDIRDLFKALTDTTRYPDEAPDNGSELDGAALFVEHCGSCHQGNGLGSGFLGDVTNESAAEITRAIEVINPMKSLSFLTTEQIEAIAAALVP